MARTQGICDSWCNGCIYFSGNSASFKVCEYMIHTGNRRPCPAGHGCTVKAGRKGRPFRKIVDNQIVAHKARAENRKPKDKLSQETIQSANDGFGASYGAWKATQPVQEVKKPDSRKVCPFCGEKFNSKVKNAVYCCTDCQKRAYAKKARMMRKQQVNTDE